ncbi:MAG TPA: MMPL family transporter [Tepidisphaeraceae bacterium]|nr:MMPL family transporter [Tepidisphaeraceae bacterium]
MKGVIPLLMAILISTAALVGCLRLRMDASLDAMFPEHDPAAAAMNDVLEHFSAADELLLLVTAPRPEPAQLLAFAQRFSHAAAQNPQAMKLIDGIVYQGQPDARQFIERQLIPAGMFYLTDRQIAEAHGILSPAAMSRRLNQDYALMSQPGPAAGGLAKALLQDPLWLHDIILPQLSASKTFHTLDGGNALISRDGEALLIRILGKRPPTDLDYAAEITRVFNDIAEQSQPGDLQARFTGAYAIASTSAAAIRHDSISSVLSSILLLIGVFAIFYRRPFGFFTLAFLPIAVGIFWGFGAYGLLGRSLSPMAAVIGGVLAGMGIDYSVLLLTRYESLRHDGLSPAEAARRTITQLIAALAAAWITSIIGFLATGWSTVRALRDFSLLGTLGLTGCFLAVAAFLPALLRRVDRRQKSPQRVRFSMDRFVGRLQLHPRALGLLFAILTVACLAIALLPRTPLVQPEPNLAAMHPQPDASLDADDEIARRFGSASSPMFVLLHADSPQKLVDLAYQVKDRLSHANGVAGTYGLDTWLPRRTLPVTIDADRVVADFNAAVAASPFNPAAFEGYATFLRQLLAQKAPPTISTLRQYPGLARDILPAGGDQTDQALTIVFLTHSTENRATRDAAIASIDSALHGLSGVTITGLDVIAHDAEAAIFQELPRLVALASLLVAIYLLIHFRSPRSMVLSLLPALIGMAALAAFVRVAAIHFNTVNLVAIPLLIGIDVDYGIYLVTLSRQRENALPSGAHAVCVCACSIIAGYISLIFTSIPAVRSLGLVVGAGVIACLMAAIFCLIPLCRPKSPSESPRSSAGN